MWPFKKKPRNLMKDFSVDITADGSSRYKVYVWRGYWSRDPKIVASHYGLTSYQAAQDKADELWKEIRETRIKAYGN